MPKLWNETIEAHRRAVREATLDATAELVGEHGLASVTMSQIAERTGIGRATLYKYFPDVGAILMTWHERQIGSHLSELGRIRDRPGTATNRLKAVLEAYAVISNQYQASELVAFLHSGEHVARARQHLQDFVGNLIEEGAGAGDLRTDIAPDELAAYCLHALAAAAGLPSKAALQRLVEVVLDGLREPGVNGRSR
jgi:AcrR family transcriptional regulator